MTQFPTLEWLRPLLRLEVAVVVAVLILAYVWYTQQQQLDDARAEESSLESNLSAVLVDLRYQDPNRDLGALQEKLASLLSAEVLQPLPSREMALRLGEDVLIYAQNQQLGLSEFGTLETISVLGEQEYSAIRYLIAARGTTDSLVGVLELLRDFPTAKVQALHFVRPIEAPESWEMNLELDVFYGNGGT